MPRDAKILRIVVASASDVQAERDLVPVVADEVNGGAAGERNLVLQVSRWEKDAFPSFHAGGPQGLIDSILHIAECDIFVGIFWTRFGTPVTDARSGTEHEYRLAFETWKQKDTPQIFFYFNQKLYNPKSKEETDQWGRVLEFKMNFPKEGLWWPYQGKGDFKELLRRHLESFIRKQFPLPANTASSGGLALLLKKQQKEQEAFFRATRQRMDELNPGGILARIRRNGVLRVGCLWYPPFVEFTQEGETVLAKGLYPMMLEHISRQSGIHVEYQILRWDTAIEAVNENQVDIVACVLQSGKRRENCDFVGTLYRVGVGGVVRADQNKIRRHEDLANPDVRIAVTKGEIGWEYAERYLNLKRGLFRFTVVEDAQITRMMNLVASQDVDIALADSLSCAQYIERVRAQGTDLADTFAQDPLHVEDNSLMIAKEQDDLRGWLSERLRLARATPEIVAIEARIASQYPDVLIKVPTV